MNGVTYLFGPILAKHIGLPIVSFDDCSAQSLRSQAFEVLNRECHGEGTAIGVIEFRSRCLISCRELRRPRAPLAEPVTTEQGDSSASGIKAASHDSAVALRPGKSSDLDW